MNKKICPNCGALMIKCLEGYNCIWCHKTFVE